MAQQWGKLMTLTLGRKIRTATRPYRAGHWQGQPEVWDWIFEKGFSRGIRPSRRLVLKCILVRNKAKELRQRGIPLSTVAEMATLGVWEAHGGGKVAG